ncbi:hypothetical protein HPB47_007206 [Ixodes persulcatus]|uniref:Uncharacterized protein n=1 Tax=Ixodes persulcatus TaxID=34615 RepID=A0AC60P870_IXOPE|nr:hypothetical protein HPB47_007206 [Ixodes persulcatus]
MFSPEVARGTCLEHLQNNEWHHFLQNREALIPPGKPVIKYVSKLTVEESVASVIGPFNEGDRLVLLCEVIGGHPTPSITWHLGSAEMDHVISQVQSEKSIAWVEIERLERRHFMNELTCSASSGGVVIPQKTSVMVDLYRKPRPVPHFHISCTESAS